MAQESSVSQAEQSCLESQSMLKREEYVEAINILEDLIEQGYQNEELHYNLGTAYLKQLNPGKAVFHLRKALRLNPNNGDTANNLQLARGLVETQVITIPTFFLARYWDSFSSLLSSSLWSWLGIGLLTLMLLSFRKWLFGNTVALKKRAFFMSLVFFFLFLLSAVAGWTKFQAEVSIKEAVVMGDTAMYEGPDSRSEELILLTPGVECTVLDQIGEFVKVELADREVGWVLEDKLVII